MARHLAQTYVRSPPDKNIALTDRRGSESDSGTRLESVGVSTFRLPDVAGEYHDAFDGGDAGASLLVCWRQEMFNALLGEGDPVDPSYLALPEGKFFSGAAEDEIQDIHQEVRNAKVKEVAGPFHLGCFKRWPGIRKNNIIDARWVATWKSIEGNVGVECGFAVRGSKVKFQDLDIYAGTISRSGRRSANAVAAGHPEFILFSLDVGQAF